MTTTNQHPVEAMIAGAKFAPCNTEISQVISCFRQRVLDAGDETNRGGGLKFADPIPMADVVNRRSRIVCAGFDYRDAMPEAFFWARITPDGNAYGFPKTLEIIVVEDGDGEDAGAPMRPFTYLHYRGPDEDEIVLRLTPASVKFDSVNDCTAITYTVEAA